MTKATPEEKAMGSFLDMIQSLGKVLPSLDEGAGTPADRLIYSCVAALIERGEAVSALLNAGHQHSCDLLIRNISEISVHLSNTAQYGQVYIDRLRITTIDSYMKRCRHVLSYSSDLLDDQQKRFLNRKISQGKAKIKALEKAHSWPPKPKKKPKKCCREKKWKPYALGVFEAFQKAQLEEDYSVYRYLCQRTHADLYRLDQDHTSQLDEFGFIDIGRPLSGVELKISLTFAAKMLTGGIIVALTHFGKESDSFALAMEAYGRMEAEFKNI